MSEPKPGQVVLFGSGETSRTAGHVLELVTRDLPTPLQIAVLETPAGFQPNSPLVAGKVAEFMVERLQNQQPQAELIAARRRQTPFSPDDDNITRPLLGADLIFLGPGSPTYAARQLRASLAWHRVVARHRLGVPLVLASAAVLALSTHTLPIYEIYKAGDDLHWVRGLDFFAPYGLPLVFVPHWNNTEGGEGLDTSRCFMGQARFAALLAMLPPGAMIVGIDEYTALLIDLGTQTCQALGVGSVTLQRGGHERVFASGASFPIQELGAFRWPEPAEDLPAPVWAEAQAAQSDATRAAEVTAPSEVLAMVDQRQDARAHHDWPRADALRQSISALGWQVQDTPDGPLLQPLDPPRV